MFTIIVKLQNGARYAITNIFERPFNTFVTAAIALNEYGLFKTADEAINAIQSCYMEETRSRNHVIPI